MARRRSLFSISEFFISDLPRELCQIILQYLQLKELSRLDQAILNHQYRQQFLSVIQYLPIQTFSPYLNDFDDDDDSGTKLAWIVSRKLLPLKLEIIYSSEQHPLVMKFLSCSTKILTHLKVQDTFDFRVLPACPSLKSLHIQREYDHLIPAVSLTPEFFHQLVVSSPKLEQITLRLVNGVPFIPLLSLCSNLTDLDISGYSWVNDVFIHSAFLPLKLNLCALNLSGTGITDQSIPPIISAFPHLCSLVCNCCRIADTQSYLLIWQQVIPRGIEGRSWDHQYHSVRCLYNLSQERNMSELERPELRKYYPKIVPLLICDNITIRNDVLCIILSSPSLAIELNLLPVIQKLAYHHGYVDETLYAYLDLAKFHLRCLSPDLQCLLFFRYRCIPLFKRDEDLHKLCFMSGTRSCGCFDVVLTHILINASPSELIQSELLPALLPLIDKTHMLIGSLRSYVIHTVECRDRKILKYLMEIGAINSLVLGASKYRNHNLMDTLRMLCKFSSKCKRIIESMELPLPLREYIFHYIPNRR